MSTYEFEQRGGTQRISGILKVKGGTGAVGDVPTQQANGDLLQAPGGGAMPIQGATDIPGCVLWLDASQIDGLSEGDPVETWPDESGNGFDATVIPEVQTIDITGASSGQYELQDMATSDSTVPIAWNANVAAVKDALEALPSIGAGNATVTLDGQVYTVTLRNLDATAISAGTFGVVQDTLDVLPTVTVLQAGSPGPPVYKTGIQNGKPVVRFDPSVAAQFLGLTGAALALLNSTDGITIAVVAPGGPSTDSGGVGGIATNYGAFFASIDGDETTARATVGDGAFTVQAPDDESPGTVALPMGDNRSFWAIICACDWGTLEVCGQYATNGFVGSGTNYASYDRTAGTDGPPVTDSQTIQIGNDPGNQPYAGDIAEIAVYDRALNALERRELIEYLSAKWATL